MQVYDPVFDSWTLKTPAPFLSGSGSAVLIGGVIFYAGGIIGSSTTDQVAAYDPVANTWSARAAMPVGVNHAAHATEGVRLFVAGGRSGGNTVGNGFDQLQIYDPGSDSWSSTTDPGSSLAPLPQARGGTGQGVFSGGEFYVFGGETKTGPGANPNNVYDRVDIYDPVANSWRAGPPIPTARHGIWPMLHAGRIYLPGGGIQAGNSQSTVFEVLRLALAVPMLAAWAAALLAAALCLIAGIAIRGRPV